MASFEELYRQHVQAVFRYSLHCVGRREVAEDITSETFLALYRNMEGIDQSQLPAWLFTVAKNRARDYWRHSEVEARYAGEAPLNASAPQSHLEKLLLETDTLKQIHRLCLLLRYIYGMTVNEIAEQTGHSATQVKGHLQYARRLLRERHARVT
jgi:RNA polymerase sigma-70 factor, ECF subfamily